MIFDPLLNSVLDMGENEVARDNLSQIIVCAHCNKQIKGKYYRSGKNYYDAYCWQFRFVIDPLYIQRASRKTIKEFDEEGCEI